MKGHIGWLALLLAGCVNDDHTFFVADVTVALQAPGTGPVTVVFHHAEQQVDDGMLAHPLGPIEDVRVDAGNDVLAHELHYPQHLGAGLVIYAWQDDDEDGALCAPGARDEAAGVTEVVDWPAHVVDATVVLDAVCRGAEGLWPP
ncbi:MAG: hypothetical protein KTR31_25780 [Myxococcales bacterium]|nr:hypothetical protein [Myxococcales bacterium]